MMKERLKRSQTGRGIEERVHAQDMHEERTRSRAKGEWLAWDNRMRTTDPLIQR